MTTAAGRILWMRATLLIALVGLLCAGCIGDYING